MPSFIHDYYYAARRSDNNILSNNFFLLQGYPGMCNLLDGLVALGCIMP